MNKILSNSDFVEYYNRFDYENDASVIILLNADNESKQVIGDEKFNETLQELFGTRESVCDIQSAISMIRTVFRKYQEKSLTVQIKKDEGVLQVYYCDETLVRYINEINKQPYGLAVSYDQQKGFSYVLSNNDNQLRSLDTAMVIKTISEELEKIELLRKVTGRQELSKGEKDLCQAYCLFYGDSPNFAKRDNKIKAQVMMFMLENAGLTFDLPDKLDFLLLNSFPESMNLDQILFNMQSFGQINQKELDTIFKPHDEIRIRVTGEIVKRYIERVPGEEIDKLSKIANIIYVKTHASSPYSSNAALAKAAKCKVSDLRNSYPFVERIEKLKEKGN